MYDIRDKSEVEDNISDCLHYLKIAFQGLFRRHEYERAELVLDAIDRLKIVLSDIPEKESTWKAMNIEDEISRCIDEAAELIDKAQQISSKY